MKKENAFDKKIISKEIIDNVCILTYDDGSQKFYSTEEKINIQEKENLTFWQKIKKWWNNEDKNITPYIKTRDLADPFNDRKERNFSDSDVDLDGKTNIEIGLKIKF